MKLHALESSTRCSSSDPLPNHVVGPHVCYLVSQIVLDVHGGDNKVLQLYKIPQQYFAWQLLESNISLDLKQWDGKSSAVVP